ncbi:MAG: LamG domain-containing protein [bacterium]|nr:LamG domain-containing protein [bacterium]
MRKFFILILCLFIILTGFFIVPNVKAVDGSSQSMIEKIQLLLTSLKERLNILGQENLLAQIASTTITAVATTTCDVSPADCVNKNLVAYWDMDQATGTTAIDNSGNNNTGTLIGGVKITNGVYGNALQFDGVNDYINVADSPSLSPTNAVTVSGWIKTSSIQPGRGVIVKGGPGNNYDYMLYFSRTTQANVNFYIRNSSGSIDTAGSYTFKYNDNAWHYYTGVFDGDWLRLYIDGKLVSSKNTVLTNIKNSINPLTIGRGWSTYFKGSIDDVRVYSRALSANEIQYQYTHFLAIKKFIFTNKDTFDFFDIPYEAEAYIDVSKNHGDVTDSSGNVILYSYYDFYSFVDYQGKTRYILYAVFKPSATATEKGHIYLIPGNRDDLSNYIYLGYTEYNIEYFNQDTAQADFWKGMIEYLENPLKSITTGNYARVISQVLSGYSELPAGDGQTIRIAHPGTIGITVPVMFQRLLKELEKNPGSEVDIYRAAAVFVNGYPTVSFTQKAEISRLIRQIWDKLSPANQRSLLQLVPTTPSVNELGLWYRDKMDALLTLDYETTLRYGIFSLNKRLTLDPATRKQIIQKFLTFLNSRPQIDFNPIDRLIVKNDSILFNARKEFKTEILAYLSKAFRPEINFNRGTIAKQDLEKEFQNGAAIFDWLMRNDYLTRISDTEGHLKDITQELEAALMVEYPNGQDLKILPFLRQFQMDGSFVYAANLVRQDLSAALIGQMEQWLLDRFSEINSLSNNDKGVLYHIIASTYSLPFSQGLKDQMKLLFNNADYSSWSFSNLSVFLGRLIDSKFDLSDADRNQFYQKISRVYSDKFNSRDGRGDPLSFGQGHYDNGVSYLIHLLKKDSLLAARAKDLYPLLVKFNPQKSGETSGNYQNRLARVKALWLQQRVFLSDLSSGLVDKPEYLDYIISGATAMKDYYDVVGLSPNTEGDASQGVFRIGIKVYPETFFQILLHEGAHTYHLWQTSDVELIEVLAETWYYSMDFSKKTVLSTYSGVDGGEFFAEYNDHVYRNGEESLKLALQNYFDGYPLMLNMVLFVQNHIKEMGGLKQPGLDLYLLNCKETPPYACTFTKKTLEASWLSGNFKEGTYSFKLDSYLYKIYYKNYLITNVTKIPI